MFPFDDVIMENFGMLGSSDAIFKISSYMDGKIQTKTNSIALAMELCLLCIKLY